MKRESAIHNMKTCVPFYHVKFFEWLGANFIYFRCFKIQSVTNHYGALILSDN